MITITPLAAARLALMIAEEADADTLGIRLVPTTTGCGSYTYSIAITEAQTGDLVQDIHGIRFLYQIMDEEKLTGTVIDYDPTSGRFSILHPRPLQTDCSHTY
ncbi:HesB/IscA family protein [Brevibacillus sp. NRS-1366]|uniref:HesB/IscA family protein n=1 Tax=Brevibacillus sp. NRS-1366 TaxID=3233899 RepID=UPI003D24BBDE